MIDYIKKWEIVFKEQQNKYYSNVTKNYLLSYSSLSSPITSLEFMKIPQDVLNQAAMFGRELMSELEMVVNDKRMISQVAPFYAKHIENLFEYIKKYINPDLTITDCEKCICDGEKIGFVDLVARDRVTHVRHIFEIKTSSNFRIKSSWINQLAIYKNILCNNNKNKSNDYNIYHILVLNKTNGRWKHWHIKNKDLTERARQMNKYINSFKEISKEYK